MKLLPFTALATVLTLTGCSALDNNNRTREPAKTVASDRALAEKEFAASAPPSVREFDQPLVQMRTVAAPRVRGPLTLRASGTPFGPLMQEAARAHGYSVMFADSVDVSRRVTVALEGAQVTEGLRSIALMAGYTVVVSEAERSFIVTDMATFTYKLPPHVMQALQAAFKVGGNPVSSNASSGGSGGGGDSANMAAEFIVSGQAGNSATSVRQLITNLAGRNAEVLVSDMGIISVRANAQAQARVHDFLKRYARDAMSQVEIEASIVEVSLTNQFEMGIDWSRVINPVNILGSAGELVANLTGQVAGGVMGTNAPSMSATFTNQSISAVVKALRQVTEAKVVSNPHVLAINNSPATFFDGRQLPYLGSVTSTDSGSVNGTTQLSGTASYAVDGISFSVQPSIIDDNRVQITLIPVLSTVTSLEKLSLGAEGQGSLTAPHQATKQSFMKVMAESGKTLILGGIRYNVEQRSDSPAPLVIGGIAREKSAKEIVILMRATVLPAEDYDPLISASM